MRQKARATARRAPRSRGGPLVTERTSLGIALRKPLRVWSLSLRVRLAFVSRQRVHLVVLCALLGACAREDPAGEIAQRWFDALNAHSAEQIVQLLTNDATFLDPTSSTALGSRELGPWLARGWAAWKDRVYTLTAVVAEHDRVVAEWHLQQTHPGGTPVPIDGVTIFDLKAGRIAKVRNYYNASVYLQFLR